MVIGAESWLKLDYTKEKADELVVEGDNLEDVKEATEKLIELAGNNEVFEGIRCNVKNKAVFGTFV